MADRPPDTGFAGLDSLGVDVGDVLRPAPGAQPANDRAAQSSPPPPPRVQPYQGAQSKQGSAKLLTGGTIAVIAAIVGVAAIVVFGVLTEDHTTETTPPVGTGNMLSRAEIRYCVAERIRLEGAQAALNHGKGDDITRFNTMVDDYNSRCSRYRYRSGDLESARSDVEPNSERLRGDGAARFGH
jgi:hypothetical protein